MECLRRDQFQRHPNATFVNQCVPYSSFRKIASPLDTLTFFPVSFLVFLLFMLLKVCLVLARPALVVVMLALVVVQLVKELQSVVVVVQWVQHSLQ